VKRRFKEYAMSDFSAHFTEISTLLQKGKSRDIVIAVQKALDNGVPAQEILDKGLIAGMGIIGEKFKRNEVFVPEVLIAAKAMNNASTVLKPVLQKAGIEPIGKAIICTVKGDLHDIGKNLVKMMIEGNGIAVEDLGVDCGADKVIAAIKNTGATVVCLSALLTTTMTSQKDIIDAIKAAGMRDSVKIMVGGAPVTQLFADEIGADAYTPDAASAAEVCKQFFVSGAA
jgi:5-methyltetrahydrofolate--homocysteine methyltransferase